MKSKLLHNIAFPFILILAILLNSYVRLGLGTNGDITPASLAYGFGAMMGYSVLAAIAIFVSLAKKN